tara:strand:- start:142 stop:600 length:459 start_codon:yes stop_codon:yes gene_type:complete
MAVIVLPELPILFTKKTDNAWSFVPEGAGAEGLLAFCDTVDPDSYTRIGLWAHHSREALRASGEVLQGVSSALGTAPSLIPPGVSTPALWAVAPALGVSVLGAIFKGIGDRDLGFINLDERFGSEFSKPGIVKRKQVSSSGLFTLNWKWVRN